MVRLSLDLASAVTAVHAAGILHRDIKASNIMLGVLTLLQTRLIPVETFQCCTRWRRSVLLLKAVLK